MKDFRKKTGKSFGVSRIMRIFATSKSTSGVRTAGVTSSLFYAHVYSIKGLTTPCRVYGNVPGGLACRAMTARSVVSLCQKSTSYVNPDSHPRPSAGITAPGEPVCEVGESGIYGKRCLVALRGGRGADGRHVHPVGFRPDDICSRAAGRCLMTSKDLRRELAAECRQLRTLSVKMRHCHRRNLGRFADEYYEHLQRYNRLLDEQREVVTPP